MSRECWLPVVGYEGFYEVSDHGNVRGVDRILTDGRRWAGAMLAQKTGHRGHKSVRLCKNKRHRHHGTHCLVLAAFVGPCPNGMLGAHEDGVPANNQLGNLRWDTPKGNHADRYRHGTILFGERNPLAKLTPLDIRRVFLRRRAGDTLKQIGDRLGVTAANISSIINGKTWCHLKEAHR